MSFSKISTKHQVTIPKEVFEELQLRVGDHVEVAAEAGKIVLTPHHMVAQMPVAKLTSKEQELLVTARQKIAAIQEDIVDSTGLIREEADVAAKAGLIDPDQQYWWTEEWQEGEREAERDIREGRVETFETPEEFRKTLETL